MGGAPFFDAIDQVQATEPQGGNVKPLACKIDCLVSNLWAVLRYLQKQQSPFLTLARNAHFRDLKAGAPRACLRQVYTVATCKKGRGDMSEIQNRPLGLETGQ